MVCISFYNKTMYNLSAKLSKGGSAASLKIASPRRPPHSHPLISITDWSVWTRSQTSAALVSKWRWQVLV